MGTSVLRAFYFLGVVAGILHTPRAWSGLDNWTRIGPPTGAPAKVLLSPAQPGVVYALQGFEVYRSEDGGARFRKISYDLDGQFVFNVAVSPASVRTLVAFTASLQGGHIWGSNNGGTHWIHLAQAPSILSRLEFAPSTTATLYSDDGELVFYSNDTGRTWQNRSGGLPAARFLKSFDIDHRDPLVVWTVVVSAGNARVFHSTTGGVTWADAHHDLPEGIVGVTADPRRRDAAYAFTATDIYLTTNGGRRWSKVNTQSLAGLNAPIVQLKVSPADPQTLYAVTSGLYLMRSDNGGRSWFLLAGATAPQHTSGVALHPRIAANLFAASAGAGVMRSESRGRRWQRPVELPGAAHGLAFDGFWPGRIYAHYVDPGESTVAFYSDVFANTEGGQSDWRRLSEPTPLSCVPTGDLAAGRQPPYPLYYGTVGGVARSLDGGASWEHRGGLSGTVRRLLVAPSDPNVLYLEAEPFGSPTFVMRETIELVSKALDGTTINGHAWFFFGALSNVAYSLDVTDTTSGEVRTYTNPAGQFASRGYTRAFATGNAATPRTSERARPCR